MLPGNSNFTAVPSDRLISKHYINRYSDYMPKTSGKFAPKNVLRYPRLDTVLMVEEAIQSAKEYPTKAELLRNLKKKMMYQTFSLILDYLEYSGKIHIGDDKKIAWIWDPKGVREILAKKHLVL